MNGIDRQAFAAKVAAHELYFTRHGLLALIVAEDGWGAQSVEADRLLTEAHADAELTAWKIGGAL